MKNLIKTIKFWEIIFIILLLINISPSFIEFLPITILPLTLVSIIPCILAFRERKHYIISINILIEIISVIIYIYIWQLHI